MNLLFSWQLAGRNCALRSTVSGFINSTGMKRSSQAFFLTLVIAAWACASCDQEDKAPSAEMIRSINLKRGEVVACGLQAKQLGSVAFVNSCPGDVRKDFDLAIALLHSFEYDEAEKVFAKVIDKDPKCAMAYWGVAMSNYHLLWTPPNAAELQKGSKAIEIAQQLGYNKTQQEAEYIDAAAQLYHDWEKLDHKTRCLNYEKAMEKIHVKYPRDKEAAALYALALNASADPTDTTYKHQRKAGAILDVLYPNELNHPGIIHYIIHTYDNPDLAEVALPAARRYASVAPSSAHALHMPSHIFIRTGIWDEAIHSNLASVSSAKCYAEQTGIKGHWDEELHGLDYLMYAYLQVGDNIRAKEQWDYLKTIDFVSPVNFKVAYAFAAMPSRYFLENKLWDHAASLVVSPANFNWKDYPWQEAIIHFARALGAVHQGKIDEARNELKILNSLRDTLKNQKDVYKASQVQIQIYASEAWILAKEGKYQDAISQMTVAADIEDKTQKHPVTPCEVLPARELLGDMLLEMNHYDKALAAYETDLKKHPNRFNGLFGAGMAAEKFKNHGKAKAYYQQLIKISDSTRSSRPELQQAKTYLRSQKV